MIPSFFLSGAHSLLEQTLLSKSFLAVMGFTLLCERLWPVDRSQPILSDGFFQDSAWFLLALLMRGTVVAFYADALKKIYDGHFSFLTLQSLQMLPEVIRFSIAILAADFLGWFQHWLKHAVPWFWQFHAVHHAQTQLNAFTDFRFHLMEYLISKPIVMLPMLVLGVEAPTFILWAVFSGWYTTFYHANIRAGLGPLRYFVVTPQSHRVHHSIEERHADKNFGVLFSFWDRIFRTQYEGPMEYPRTGIRDTVFPYGKGRTFSAWFLSPLKQLIYPFQTTPKK